MDLATRFAALMTRIRTAEQQFQRPAHAVQLLAVSKTQAPAQIAALAALGQRHFGENYLQEALEKIAALADLQLHWHFIGPIQANKTRQIAAHFDWVHSVERWKIAERLSAQRPAHLPPLNLCLQVNLDREASKSGVLLEDVAALATAVAALPRVRLRGLMALPAASCDFAAQRYAFARLRAAQEQLQMEELDTLSMGMSDDLEAAVAEGATIVRVGTALFGARFPMPKNG